MLGFQFFDWMWSLENQQKDVKKLHFFDWLRSLETQQKDVKKVEGTLVLKLLEKFWKTINFEKVFKYENFAKNNRMQNY